MYLIYFLTTDIMFLDIINCPVFIQNTKTQRFRTGLCLRPIRIGTSSIDWAQLSRFI
jgi:hypothetical protein